MTDSDPAALPRPKRTILVLDDDVVVQQTIARLLARAGFEVLAANTAVEAIETAADHERTIDLLIADHGLGAVSGVGVGEVLSRGRPSLRVLYISGSEVRDVLGTGPRSPAVGFLQKPFSKASLLEQVHRLLERA